MRLAPRLALTFGLLAVASTAFLGVIVRERLRAGETRRFRQEVEGVCERVALEVKRQGQADQRLISGACQGGELVDRVVIAANRGTLDELRTGYSLVVPEEREAFDLDELMLAMQGGDIIGASPMSLLGTPTREVDHLLANNPKRHTIRTTGTPAIVARCTKPTDSGRLVGLIAARHLDTVLDRVGKATTIDVEVIPSWPRASAPTPKAAVGKRGAKAAPSATAIASATPRVMPDPSPRANAPTSGFVRTTCTLPAEEGSASLSFDVLKSTRELDDKLGDLDRALGLAAALSAVVTVAVGILLGLRLGKPLSELATEAGKVAAGEARPLEVRGSGEVQELAHAFDRMIEDLAATRRRLAAASRVAAWREVARRVAHEVKNPLAPIRAAVETLRRLRAREDPRFDEYFDEATRTVLDEVHRIANIVTEFTRFARLPPPNPQDVDVEDLARHVVQIHKAAAGEIPLAHVAQRRAPTIRADRDQIIQVLTNLVQNALDAVRDVPGGAVTVSTDTDGSSVTFSIADNGQGIAPEIAARLFEPYATTKASGTGLGLAIAQRIALEHNGELAYVGPSASGKGAVFRLLLPIDGPSPAADAPAPSDP